MPNQQLTDYVNQCLAAGQTKEQIKQSLLQSGWQDADVDDALGGEMVDIVAPMDFQQPKRFPTKLLAGAILGAVILIAIGGGIYWRQKKQVETKQESKEMQSAVLPSSNEEVKNLQTINSAPTSAICDNYQCLISAASQCQPISVVISYSDMRFPFDPAIVMSGQAKYEIKKSSGANDCILILSSPATVFSVSDEGRKAVLAGGMTDAQITAQLQTMNDSLKLASEAQTTCLGDVSIISEYLSDAKNGNSKVEVTVDLAGQQISTYTTSSGKKLVCTITLLAGQPANTSATINDKECAAQKGVATVVTNAGTACSKYKIDIGTIVGNLKLNEKYPQCCVNK